MRGKPDWLTEDEWAELMRFDAEVDAGGYTADTELSKELDAAAKRENKDKRQEAIAEYQKRYYSKNKERLKIKKARRCDSTEGQQN